jgi:hypothetical protein
MLEMMNTTVRARETALNTRKAKELISILMESPIYMTLIINERHALIKKLMKDYKRY